MMINNYLNIKNLYISSKDEFFKEGKMIEGEILELKNELAIIDIKGFGKVQVTTEKNLNDYYGKILTFRIKSSLNDKIELKPIINDISNDELSISSNKKEEYLTNVLKEFHIKDDSVSIDFLDNLLKYNVQINKENLTKGIAILEKLEQLLNIEDDQTVVLASPKKNSLNPEQEIRKDDITNILIEDKVQNSIEAKNDISPIIKEYINNSFKDGINKKLIKTIAFFIKHKIKPTLNNIKYFIELGEDSRLFSKDFEKLKNLIDKKFTNIEKDIIIDNGSAKNLIEENHIKYIRNLDEVLNYIKENDLMMDKNIKDNMNEFINKIEFLKEMNRELNFIYLPLNLDDSIYKSAITLLKKKKKKNEYNEKTNIFINLSTKHLGNIKISCEVLDSNINIRFNGIKNEDMNLFKMKEDELKTIVKSTSYKIGTIKYGIENNEDILDSLIVNQNSLYYLDVQV